MALPNEIDYFGGVRFSDEKITLIGKPNTYIRLDGVYHPLYSKDISIIMAWRASQDKDHRASVYFKKSF
jgi:hypothetical protein